MFTKGRSWRRAGVLFGLLLTPVVSGCGSAKQPWETVYPAKGVVTYKGVAVKDAEIALFPQGDSVPATVRPRARTGEDGTFVIWTNQPGDGAPAGKYKLTIQHNVVTEKNGVGIVKPNDLPPKYATQQTTDWVAEIGTSATEIPPIDLK